jgi:hypothetical protein
MEQRKVTKEINGRKLHFENEMCEAVGLMTQCNSCDRIIFEDEFDEETYYPMGYCKECYNEASGIKEGANEIKKIAMNIVNQLYDLAEVPVKKRQAINDKADEFVIKILQSAFEKSY